MAFSGLLIKPALLLSSYAPLFAILAIRFEPRWLLFSCAAVAAAGIVALSVLLLLESSTGSVPVTVKSARPVGHEAAGYLASYLLPFVTITSPSVRDVVAYVAFLVVAAAITLRTPVVQVNPLLYLVRRQVVEVENSQGRVRLLVTKKAPSPGQTITVRMVNDEVMFWKS